MVRSLKMWVQFLLFRFSATHYTWGSSCSVNSKCIRHWIKPRPHLQVHLCKRILAGQKFVKIIICKCFNEIILTQRQKKQQKDTRKPWVNDLNLKASTKISKYKNIVYFCFTSCGTSHRYIFFTYGATKDLFETWIIVRKTMLLH